jgi:hypothetical protein
LWRLKADHSFSEALSPCLVKAGPADQDAHEISNFRENKGVVTGDIIALAIEDWRPLR